MTKLKDLKINNPFLENIKKNDFYLNLCRIKNDYELHLSMIAYIDLLNGLKREEYDFGVDRLNFLKSISLKEGDYTITPFLDYKGCYVTFYHNDIEQVKILVNYHY